MSQGDPLEICCKGDTSLKLLTKISLIIIKSYNREIKDKVNNRTNFLDTVLSILYILFLNSLFINLNDAGLDFLSHPPFSKNIFIYFTNKDFL